MVKMKMKMTKKMTMVMLCENKKNAKNLWEISNNVESNRVKFAHNVEEERVGVVIQRLVVEKQFRE